MSGDRLARPELSVVIAASDSPGAVARTLASLARQRGVERAEILVAAGPGVGVPRLRALGLKRATAPVVVFTEDSCVFGLGWLESWLRAFDSPYTRAATGPVLPGIGDSLLDWAVFFCEYVAFLPENPTTKTQRAQRLTQRKERRFGQRQGFFSLCESLCSLCLCGKVFDRPTPRLAGNNFAVRRDFLSPGCEEVHETEVVGPFQVVPARAWHVRRYSLREALRDRLRFGFEYGKRRAGGWPAPVRVAGVFAGPAILAVQAARLTRHVLARPRYLGRFLECLPVTLPLLAAWSVGEWLGWQSASRPRAPGRSKSGTTARTRARPGVRA